MPTGGNGIHTQKEQVVEVGVRADPAPFTGEPWEEAGRSFRPLGKRSLASDEPEPKLLLTMEEAARLLGIGRDLIYRLALSQPPHLRTIKIGRYRRVPRQSIDQFIEACLEVAHG